MKIPRVCAPVRVYEAWLTCVDAGGIRDRFCIGGMSSTATGIKEHYACQ